MPHLGTDPPQPLLALPGPRNCYRYDGEFTIAGQPIVVHQEGGQGRGTGWAVWDAAATLALYLEAAAPQLQSELRPGAAILELGSGTGLAGLAAAAALRRPAVLTDLPDVLPALQRNVDANPQLRPLVRTAACDWLQPAASLQQLRESSGASGVGLVLAADCVWLQQLVRPFVDALAAATQGAPTTLALLAHQTRCQRVDDELFRLLGERFDVREAAPAAGEPHCGPICIYELRPLPASDGLEAGAARSGGGNSAQ